MAEMANGIMLALEPMLVPIKKRDKGKSKIIKMIKGKERVMLIEVSKILCKRGLFNRCPFLLTNNKTPKGKPKTTAKKLATNTI
ncbi:hypothetical protein HMPREF1430_01478 [Helicobacter pylori GAM96Ai]|nr:hypothetical protein HMPREF1430_01478 [Helicobacter pylori GAM96Ai]